MTMRIAKYLPIAGVGGDAHCALPPITPPVPPSPAPIPMYRWLVTIINTGTAALTGKFCIAGEMTEGMGVILWQYDWGPLQPHIPLPPIVTPSIATTLAGSTVKYFLPSFSVTERIDGGMLAALQGGDAPVAISWPAYCIVTESCQDLGPGIGIVAPTSICFQQFSTRWVGFTWGDLAAGVIGMVGDAVCAAIGSFFGGRFIPGNLDDQLIGGLASSGFVHMGTVLGSLPEVWRNISFATGTGMAIGGVVIEVGAVSFLGAIVLGPMVSFGANTLAQDVGERWGSGRGDTGPAPGQYDSAPSSRSDGSGTPSAPGDQAAPSGPDSAGDSGDRTPSGPGGGGSDGGDTPSGPGDAGPSDAGSSDAGSSDGGVPSGPGDAGPGDGDSSSGPRDAGPPAGPGD